MPDAVSLGGATGAVTSSPATSASRRAALEGSFARELERRASKATTAGGASADAADATRATGAVDGSGLTTVAVAGHSYSKVTSGAHAGSYRNDLASSPRHDQLFRVEHRDGRTLHVYGQGDHRTVIALAAKGAAAAAAPATTTPPTTSVATPATSEPAATTTTAATSATPAATADPATTAVSVLASTSAGDSDTGVDASAVGTGADGLPLATS